MSDNLFTLLKPGLVAGMGRALLDAERLECRGHCDDLSGPAGVTTYCDGTCRTLPDDYDPCCALCQTGEEPGHEH